MKKKLITTSIVLFILIVIVILFINMTKKIKNEQKTNDLNISIITKNYDNFQNSILEYNKNRNDIIDIINNFYYDSISIKDEQNKGVLSNQEDMLDSIKEMVLELDNKCDRIYKDININNICDRYKGEYEILVNVFINDINSYNNKLSIYNKDMNDNIDLYKTEYEYIDYNNDNIYEEVENND